MRSIFAGLIAVAAVIVCATPAPSAQTPPAAMPPEAPVSAAQTFMVMLAPGTDSMSGRLIAVAAPVASVRAPAGAPYPPVISGGAGYVAAQDAPIVTAGQPVRFDADMIAYPTPLSRVTPGDYWVQVRLDVNRNAAYRLSDPAADYVSTPVKMTLPATEPVRVTLKRESEVVQAGSAQTSPPPVASPDEADAHIKQVDFVSPSLSAFWGRPVSIRGIVLLPPGYETSRERYPAVYRTEGFGGSMASLPFAARRHFALMKSGETPPMIRVFLDHSSPWGTHEFADSVNNGPWGKALTEELIPALEKQYRMDGKPSGRFVTGHSSGGWFAIWQIVRYPKVYGGSWARSPDPVDFRSFTGIDIYRDGANAYVRPDGSPQYLVRDADGKQTTSFREYSQREDVLGEFGGQIDSFDWVFSPRGIDGRPAPLFDRKTGKVDAAVAAYWRENFDISHIVRRDWKTLKPALDGKIHLIMGTMDTFHLDEAARLLEQELKTLGAKADFFWMEGRGHGNIDRIEDDPNGLEKKIAWEMWAVARPNSKLKPNPRQ